MLIRQANHEYYVCHYWHFLNKGFKFRPYVHNRCHDLLMMSMNLSDIAILNNRGSDYRCIISRISWNEAINLTQNADLSITNYYKMEHHDDKKFIITYKNG